MQGLHFGMKGPAYSQAHSPVWVQRCEEDDGFDKKAKHTPSLEFYLQGNPGCIIRECKQSFYIWLRHETIRTKLFITLKQPFTIVYPFTKSNLAWVQAGMHPAN